MDKPIKLNGVALTEAQFKDKKEEVSSQKGVKIVEVSTGVFKTEIRG